MKIAIIDYGSGNLRSAAKAFERAASEAEISAQVLVTSNPEDVLDADRILLPGVGAFADCLAGVTGITGMMAALTEVVIQDARPFLGICVGMQLMATRGLEHGTHPGFDWIKGEVKLIEPSDASLKIPHMGWNTIQIERPHPVFEGLGTGDLDHAYFVHSYHFEPDNADALIATTNYGTPVTAAIGRDNLVGTQFHPEKSQATGLRLISNFLKWSP